MLECFQVLRPESLKHLIPIDLNKAVAPLYFRASET